MIRRAAQAIAGRFGAGPMSRGRVLGGPGRRGAAAFALGSGDRAMGEKRMAVAGAGP